MQDLEEQFDIEEGGDDKPALSKTTDGETNSRTKNSRSKNKAKDSNCNIDIIDIIRGMYLGFSFGY